jgi:hypothetical protein
MKQISVFTLFQFKVLSSNYKTRDSGQVIIVTFVHKFYSLWRKLLINYLLTIIIITENMVQSDNR